MRNSNLLYDDNRQLMSYLPRNLCHQPPNKVDCEHPGKLLEYRGFKSRKIEGFTITTLSSQFQDVTAIQNQ